MLRNPLNPRPANLAGGDPFGRCRTHLRPASADPSNSPGSARALIRSACRAATVKLDQVVDNTLAAREQREVA